MRTFRGLLTVGSRLKLMATMRQLQMAFYGHDMRVDGLEN